MVDGLFPFLSEVVALANLVQESMSDILDSAEFIKYQVHDQEFRQAAITNQKPITRFSYDAANEQVWP